MSLIMRCERIFEVGSQAASLPRGRISRGRARRRGSRAQPSRGMNRVVKGVFFDRLNEVEEDVVGSIGVRRKRDLAETHEVSFNGGARDELRMFLPVAGKGRAIDSSDNFEDSTWRGPRAPRRPTTTTRRHEM